MEKFVKGRDGKGEAVKIGVEGNGIVTAPMPDNVAIFTAQPCASYFNIQCHPRFLPVLTRIRKFMDSNFS